MKTFTIRRELPEEQRKVESLIRESFWNVYRPGCLVDEAEAEEFDKLFPPKEKLKLPGQLW